MCDLFLYFAESKIGLNLQLQSEKSVFAKYLKISNSSNLNKSIETPANKSIKEEVKLNNGSIIAPLIIDGDSFKDATPKVANKVFINFSHSIYQDC